MTNVMDELTIHIQDDVPRCILLADDIISVDESKREELMLN